LASGGHTVLVVGGAGYIGSHTAIALAEAGYRVVILDDLSSGFDWAVSEFVHTIGDVRDRAVLDEVFATHAPAAVLHLAARIEAGESVAQPLPYYANNVGGLMDLLGACERHSVDKLVFASTAAIYGDPADIPIPEEAAMQPASPYGASKAACERILADVATATPLRYVALRFFNVAGAHPAGQTGESHEPESHLIPIVAQAALGLREGVTINGDDYPTPDGTCIRDYVHVLDIAAAHVQALDYLMAGEDAISLNCGYGHGYSVAEIVETVQDVAGADIAVRHGPRRPGDVPELVAANDKIRLVLGWQPKHDDLREMVRSVLDWERGGRLPLALRGRTKN
jgi:UDP-glucose 4-epimerase